jgi:cell wall-associated NlpC family hydrolase
MDVRRRIVEEARTYLGVKFGHRGRSHRTIDCVGLLYCVFNEVVGMSSDYQDYPVQPTSARCYAKIREYADRIVREDAGPGDVILMHFAGISTHFGILTENGVIHANRYAGKVTEHSIDSLEKAIGPGRIVAYFRIRGVPPWRQ